ncbi:MAG: protein kinase [Pseudomonadota bacterium]
MQETVFTPQARFAARFVLLEKIHSGAHTEVWLADDTRAQIPVALKILCPSSAERLEARTAFENEWHIARGLNHPHTVRALSWHEDGCPAYAMQYIDGTDASDLVGRGLNVWGSVVRVVAESLDYWHRKGVVHGDIKPSNILLDRRGTTYLGDFGSATLIDSDIEYSRRGGTAAYASPEQAAGDPPHPADDAYALAQVVAELATGDPSADYPDAVPPAVRALLTAARGPRAKRPSMAEIATALEGAGVTRSQIDLRALEVRLRRPASSIAGAEPAPLPALPHGAFERDVPVQESSGVSPMTLVGGLVGVLLFGVLFTQGLQWFTRDEVPAPTETQETTESQGVGDTDTSVGAAESESDANEEAIAAQRRAVDELVFELLVLDDGLTERAVSIWGGVVYESGKARYEEGDRAYLARDFALAETRYREAIALLEPLVALADTEYQRAMDNGDAAFFAEDSVAAIAAYERALQITPGDTAATAALERATRLDDVLVFVRRAREFEVAGELIAARDGYQAALDLDARWQPALEGLARMNVAILEDRFATRMSEGFAALAANNFESARRAFGAARDVRNDPSVADAFLQVRLAERQAELESALERGAEFEASEAWIDARDVYAKLLEDDPNLNVAREGLARSQDRIDLLARSQSYLDNPDQLSDINALRAASRLLTQMDEVAPRGPAFASRMEALSELLKRAAIPVAVTLRSDGETEITVLRVAQLGTITETELRLRPGLYTVVGSRRGFKDARAQFRVVSGQSPEPVYLACEQPI